MQSMPSLSERRRGCKSPQKKGGGKAKEKRKAARVIDQIRLDAHAMRCDARAGERANARLLRAGRYEGSGHGETSFTPDDYGVERVTPHDPSRRIVSARGRLLSVLVDIPRALHSIVHYYRSSTGSLAINLTQSSLVSGPPFCVFFFFSFRFFFLCCSFHACPSHAQATVIRNFGDATQTGISQKCDNKNRRCDKSCEPCSRG